MIKRSKSGDVEFRFACPSAREVILVGDFAGQEQDETNVPMARTPSGEWVCKLHLKDGVYHFKYWVDGGWALEEDMQHTSPAASFLTSAIIVTSPYDSLANGYVG